VIFAQSATKLFPYVEGSSLCANAPCRQSCELCYKQKFTAISRFCIFRYLRGFEILPLLYPSYTVHFEQLSSSIPTILPRGRTQRVIHQGRSLATTCASSTYTLSHHHTLHTPPLSHHPLPHLPLSDAAPLQRRHGQTCRHAREPLVLNRAAAVLSVRTQPPQFRKLFPLLTALKCVTNCSVSNDGVKGSWFAGIPKRVIVNGA
jgi:hypothetical protein